MNRFNVRDLASLRAACTQDRATHCWIWNGCVAKRDGLPRIYTVDLESQKKCAISGPRAAWMLAHNEPPLPGYLVFRCCHNKRCVNPAHLRIAQSKRAIFDAIRRSKAWVGNSREQRLANIQIAWKAQGKELVDADTVRAVRSAPSSITGRQLAAEHGISPQAISRMRRGLSYAWIE